MVITAAAQTPVASFQEGEWLRSWLLCGPIALERAEGPVSEVEHLPGFETDYLKPVGGEADAQIRPGQSFSFAGKTLTFVPYTAQGDKVDLDIAISKSDQVLAYAYCEVVAAEDKVVILALGSNDGGRAWLNGEMIWDHPGGRGLTADDDRIPVYLKKGNNRLLLKIEERGNAWGFCLRFLPFDAGRFVQEIPLFNVIPREDGQGVLRFLQSESVIDQLFRSAELQVTSQEDRGKILWKAAWSKEKEMELLPGNQAYGRFEVVINALLTDGKKWTNEIPFAMGIRNTYVLFDNRTTDYRIVIDEDASESEQWAAKELQQWLKKLSGADFPVQSEDHPKKIVVGYNDITRALLGDSAQKPADDDESFTYRNMGPDILIWGGSLRGTMYGVMTFLENELGCRWYTSRVSVIPQKQSYAFDYLYHKEIPGIRVRNDFYHEAFEPIWAARNKVNGAMNYREQPGGVEGYWAVHTFYRFMPPDEFFAAHPEFYSLIDGQRVADHTQLCLTNAEVLKIVTERLKKTIRENPQYLIYSVSQNDWSNPCQCDKCQAIAVKEESESGPIVWFVNQVAKEIEQEFPDKYVGTLAYSYTRKPPKTLKPRENVVIRLCSIECCFAHDFNSCPENASFVHDLQGWSGIAPHLYIWDYVVNFSHYILPYPNFRVLQNNIRMFRDNKAIGIMEQAAYQSRGGEFAELRAYLISKLLWDPECNTESVINDFMYGYYGRSGQYIRSYFDLLHGRITADTHIHLGLRPDDQLFSDNFIRQADLIFDSAEAVADNEEIRQRVEMARLPLMYLKCRRTPVIAKYDGTYSRFRQIVEREGITHFAEAGQPHVTDFYKSMDSAK